MHRNSAVAAGLFCLALAAVPAVADDSHDHSKQAADATQQEAEMQKYMQLAAPGEHHKHIAAFAGTWTSKNKVWQAPGAPPVESEGKSTNQMVLGGRFLHTTYASTMMGMPFEGMGLDGFDNASGKHLSLWADNFGTMMILFEGTCSKDGSTTMHATYNDPMTGKPTTMRTVSRQLSPTQHVFEMFSPGPDGKEFKNMEITYTKVAEAKQAGS